MRTRYFTIDLIKYICSLLIISIHSALFFDVSKALYFGTVQIVARMAVPYFAVCTGFFAGGNPESESGDALYWKNYFIHHWNRWLVVYLIWSMLYMSYSIPEWIESGWFSKRAFADFWLAAVRSGSHYHLWYMLSLLYAWPFLYLCLSNIKSSLWLPISIILYTYKVLSYGYYNYMHEAMQGVMDLCGGFSALADAIFLLLPLMLLGAYIHRKSFPRMKICAIGLIISTASLILEASHLYGNGHEQVAYLFSTYFVVYFTFCMIVQIKCPISEEKAAALGTASAFIYYFHPMVIELFHRVHLGSIATFMITAVTSTVLWMVYWIKNEKKRSMKAMN